MTPKMTPNGALTPSLTPNLCLNLPMFAVICENEKARNLNDYGLFQWSCYPDSNWGPHPYQAEKRETGQGIENAAVESAFCGALTL